jgi:hypothetical protein
LKAVFQGPGEAVAVPAATGRGAAARGATPPAPAGRK